MMLRRIIQKRPLSSLGLASTAGLVGVAHYVEWETTTSQQQDFLPREYNRQAIQQYWSGRPVTVAKRLAEVAHQLVPRLVSYIWDFQVLRGDLVHKEQEHAVQLRQALTSLGPAWIKGGQQLSIRPDLVSPIILRELQKLCDAVQPVPDEVALAVLRNELQCNDLTTLFENLHLVASASLGQVYKAQLKSTGENVAIKVQRPGMLSSFSLDLYLLLKLGVALDAFATTFTHQAAYHLDLLDTFSRASYLELDYQQEAANQELFQRELSKRHVRVKVPSVYRDYTTRRVLTTEWINGVKLADSSQQDICKLIPDGVELFLTQLLDLGHFHADPHPGNLYVTTEGQLCLLDFGLCAQVDEHARKSMTRAICNLLKGDFDALVAVDAKELGFLPHDLDTEELKPILTKILTKGLLESGSNLHARRRKLMDISEELNDVFFRHPFSVPPFFALVTRGLGLLEGIALSGDPDFDIFRASLPYAKRRAVKMAMGGAGWRRSSSNQAPTAGALELQRSLTAQT